MHKIACRKAFSQILLRLGQENRDIYAVTSDARGSVTIQEFARQLPDQLIECGIAEQNEIGVAAGMALAGKTVFVCAPAPFLSARGYEQLKLDAAYNRANVKICGVSGGVSYGTLGTSHHALQDIAAMAAGIGVMEDEAYTRANCRAIMDNRAYAAAELTKLGFVMTDSMTNFLFVRHPKVAGGEIYRALKERGILVRHFDGARIAEYNRITVGTGEQMDTLIQTLRTILEERI